MNRKYRQMVRNVKEKQSTPGSIEKLVDENVVN